MTFDLRQYTSFLSLFDLAGVRKDGKLYSSGRPTATLDEWPKEVIVNGTIYKLQNVVHGRDGFESAVYTAV